MTTAELIAALQAADPSGALDVVCGCEPIIIVEREPAYWDGPYHKFHGGWWPTSAEIVSKGEKVRIRSLSIEWVLMDAPDLPVTCPDAYRATVDRWRAEAREIDAEIKAERDAKGEVIP